MNIKLGKWTLKSDEFNYIVGVTKIEKTGYERLRKKRYFAKLDDAVSDILQRDIRSSDATTLAELVSFSRVAEGKLSKLISEQLTQEYKVVAV